MDKTLPVVSIICLTFNHEKFVSLTLQGFINQKTNFPFEIIVHDDASTDRTVEIIKEYEGKFPELFSNIYQQENLYSKGKGDVGKTIFKVAKGKYIAFCDGDDFWTDIYKLQTQVDFLESHSGYVGCFHNAEERYEDSNKASFLYCKFPEARGFSFADLTLENPIPTCSVVYRNRLLSEFPEWFYLMKMGDWPLYLLNAQFGDFWYMPKIMAVHTLHINSVWAMQDNKRNKQFLLDAYNIMISGFESKDRFRESLISAKEQFIAANKKPSFFERGLRFAKRLAGD